MADLFPLDESREGPPDRPLPDRLRPRNLDEIVGQDHLIGEGVGEAAQYMGSDHNNVP